MAKSTLQSSNLLEMRYGEGGNSGRALYITQRDGAPAEKRDMDENLLRLFSGPMEPAAFGPRFDAFAQYLREKRLGCPWDFMAYLAFIADPEQRYVPVKSTAFGRALRYYGYGGPFGGRVEWHRYEAVLRLLDALTERLESHYGPLTRLDAQGYLWVIGNMVLPRLEGDVTPPMPKKGRQWDEEAARREAAARRRERTGLRGERLCYERERKRLTEGGRPDLAKRVELVSITGTDSGYDLRTFEADGTEVHAEIKTTTWPRSSGRGFWLSENERQTAERDSAWTLWRVWSLDEEPEVEELGPLIPTPNGWSTKPGSWFFQPCAVAE
ncbi:MAG TPA: DUF3883 domain-containing protein [Bacteroidetes bacterium]|nr:DUF3883 domain-containing protein [Bacteroidota bacterium]